MDSYDQDSGQVYREWTIARPTLTPSHDRDWSRAQPTSTRHARGAKGPRTLVDMATSVVAMNIASVTEAHLDGMPPLIRLRLWQFLEARGANLYAWKLFQKHLLRDEVDSEPTLSQYRFRRHICRPSSPLPIYTEPLTSPTCDFITHLVISGGCDFPTSEMITLADMPNLGVLEIIQPADEVRTTFPEVTDRLVRGWTSKPNPFPVLRVLRIWGDQTTTQDSLQHLAKLPSLALYDVMGAREDWEHTSNHDKLSGWLLANSASTKEASLLRYLMLFAPGFPFPQQTGEWPHLSSPLELVDRDLGSLCEDSQSEVKFVPYGEAPELLDYLTDGSRIRPTWKDSGTGDARGCQGAVFEPWAFWLYSFIGQITHDRDLSPETQAVAGPFVLPSKPMACVFLGHNGRGGIATRPSYIRRGLFATKRYTFTRTEMPAKTKKKTAEEQNQSQGKEERKVRLNKRQKLDDLLGHFG